MTPMRRLALAALPLLSSCAYTTKSTSLASTPIGHKGVAPKGFVTGYSKAFFVLWWGPFGDDSEEAAANDARGKAVEQDLADAVVERQVLCVPTCLLPIVRRTRTVVNAAVVAPTGFRELPQAAKPPAPPNPRDPSPSVEILYHRLRSMHRADPDSAKHFYESLGSEERQVLREYVVAHSGVGSVAGGEYRIPSGAKEDDRRFAEWFLIGYTPYQPVND